MSLSRFTQITTMKSPKLLTLAATAALITSASAAVNIDWIDVGNAGNAADTTGFGAVSYAYQIGKYEVTNAQYGEFLNAKAATDSYGLYNTTMAIFGIAQSGDPGSFSYSVSSGYENRPVTLVSWFDVARFANWMNNGQGAGSTETGAYTLNGATSGIIQSNPGAIIRAPTEDEWYKAAYYNPNTTVYSLFANGSSIGISSRQANFDPFFHTGDRVNYAGGTTDVGSYSSVPSAYGTYDQGGNVQEWNDGSNGLGRGVRGGSWDDPQYSLASDDYAYSNSDWETEYLGFRLAKVAIPEPSTSILTVIGVSLLFRRRR
jgi:sulfatase modifying factor 1